MLYFIYENDNLIEFKYNDDKYYYIKNIQEDIIGIMDNTLQQVVSYEYDSWGNILSIKDNNNTDVSNDLTHIANINPFRYRSYYYDIETKLYYLNSRYYNPEWDRFINADSYVSTGQGFFGHNMYSYTENNYVSRTDVGGKFWFQVAGAAIGGLIGITTKIVSNYITGENLNNGLWGAATGGAVSGLLMTTSFGLTTAGIVTAAYTSTFVESTTNQIMSGQGISISTIGSDTLSNGTLNLVTDSFVGDAYSINKGWFRPKTFESSFTGNYTKKITSNLVLSNTSESSVSITKEKIVSLINEIKQINNKINAILSTITASYKASNSTGGNGSFGGGSGGGTR